MRHLKPFYRYRSRLYRWRYLKTVIKEQSRLQDDKVIEQIIKFNEDLRTMTKQGQISEKLLVFVPS